MASYTRIATAITSLLSCTISVLSVETNGVLSGRTLRGKDGRGYSTDGASLRDRFHDEYLHASKRDLEGIERSLAPMYAALPKNGKGLLGHATTAYALRRYFLAKYGWLVTGLAPQGSDWNFKDTSATKVMQGRVPGYLQELLEDDLGGRGLNLERLATLVFMLEQALHEESAGWLGAAYRLVGAPLTGRASRAQIVAALETFMVLYQNDEDIHRATPLWLAKYKRNLEKDWAFELWKQTQVWLHDTLEGLSYKHRFQHNPFINGSMTFPAAESLLAEIHRQYSKVQHGDCLEMKDLLLSLEDSRASGRITFEKFNTTKEDKEVSVKWDLGETIDEMRKIGALDESDPRNPKVIVANYIYNPGNCLASSELHKVCCVDECEALVSEVEKAIGAPSGWPAKVANRVSRLETATVDAPRNLSTSLLSRLAEIADRHGGRVPLHGRLFAQWMHHAFPNECAHPLSASSPAARTPEEYMRESNGEGEENLPWSYEEELVDDDVRSSVFRFTVPRFFTFVAFLWVAAAGAQLGFDKLKNAGKDDDGPKKKLPH